MQVKLKKVRLSFPDLWIPQTFKDSTVARFSATFLIQPQTENDRLIRTAIREVAKEQYGAKSDKMLASWEGNSQKYCYIDGDLQDYDGYEGVWALSSHNKSRPKIVDRNPNNDLTEADGRPYAGCYVNAVVDIYAQRGTYPGIRAALRGVQFVEDGEAFSGSPPASVDDFETLEEDAFDEFV